jgi:SPP1 family predicted phage head-tail adaptor
MSLSTRLNQRVKLQSRSATKDGAGQPVETWSDVVTVWASVSDLTGREFLAASAERAAVTTRIIIRKRTGVTAAMRVLHGTVVYDIDAVLDDGNNRTLQLLCKRV